MFSNVLRFLKKEWVLIMVLLILSVATRFLWFGHPDRIVFDELYFAKFVSQYFLHSYYFDIHPPLAKLIMAGIAKLAGADPILTFGYTAINESYPDRFYLLLRGIVSFFGSLLPLGVYALSRSLSFSKRVAFVAGLFVVLDTALLVQSRFILTDAFLLVFGSFGLALVLFAIRQTAIRYGLLVAGAALLGCSIAVKWTGLLFLAVALSALFIQAIRTKRIVNHLKTAVFVLLITLIIYAIPTFIHVGQLDKTGTGDAFMSVEFQSTLLGNQHYQTKEGPGLVSKSLELQGRMYTANAGISASHPDGSKWHTWPLLQRSVYYWQNTEADGKESKIYLLGNPLIWWGGLIAMIMLSGWAAFRTAASMHAGKADPVALSVALLCVGYWLNLIAYIPIARVAFLYHYFPSLLFLMIGLAYALERMRWKWITLVFVIACMAAFVWLAPVSYGFPLTPAQFDARMLIDSWK